VVQEQIVKQYLRDGEVVTVTGDQSLHDMYAMFPEVDDEAALTVDDEAEESSDAEASEDSEADSETTEEVVEGSGVEEESEEETEEAPAEAVDEDRPLGNSGTEEWYAYRLTHGYAAEELEALGRNELRDLADR